MVWWRAISVAALSVCAYLLFLAPSAAVRGASDEAACDEEASGALPASRSVGATRRSDSASLAQLMAALGQAHSLPARCGALRRLARSGDVNEAAVERIARYAERSHPYELRSCAIAALGDSDDSATVPYLTELAHDVAPPISEAALRALAGQSGEDARQALLALAIRGPRSLRVAAAIALAEVGRQEATGVIVELLEGAAMHERERLVVALGTTGDPRALPVLQGLLTSGSRSLAHAVVSALGELGGQGATRTLLQLLRERPALAPSVTNALARIGDGPAREALLAAAEGSEAYGAASSALSALTPLDGDDVRAIMGRALASGNPARVNSAAEYFAARGDQHAVSELSALVRQGSPHSLYPALHALARIGGDEARSLLESLASGDGRTKEAALGALATMPDGAEQAREIALRDLQRGGTPSGQALELLAGDDSPEAQTALIAAAERGGRSAMHAMMMLANRSDPVSRRALEQLATSANSPEARGQALLALSQSGDPSVTKTLRAALQSEHAVVRAQALSAMAQTGGPEAEDALIAASHDKSTEVASSATGMLAQVGTARALSRLEEVAASADPQVARQALFALSSSAPQRAAPLVEKLAASSDPAARQTALMVVGALPESAAARILLGGLRDSDPAVVSDALNGLGGSGLMDDAKLRPALLELSESARLPEEIKERARQMLAGEAGHSREMEFRARHHGPY